MNVQVASGVTKQLTTYDLRKLNNFQKNYEMFGVSNEYSTGDPKVKY